MNRIREPVVSLCEKAFLLEAIKEGKVSVLSGVLRLSTLISENPLPLQRIDGREAYDYRSLQIHASTHQPGSVEVMLGKTRYFSSMV